MTKIKICGLTREEDADWANQLTPDYIGFVFAKGSKRCLSSEKAEAIRKRLNPAILSVGVFVNQTQEEILRLCRKGIIDVIQLHGCESEAYIRTLQERTEKKVIKAFRIETQADAFTAAQSCADFILLDNGSGGTGEAFNWQLVKNIDRPFFLAGGLKAENVREAIRICRPYAVDVSSHVETEGVKEYTKVKQFIHAVRNQTDGGK